MLALWKHYQASGAEEGREARSEEVLEAEREAEAEAEAEREAAEKAEAEQKPQETPKQGAHTERVELPYGGWEILEHNKAGQQIKMALYNADDSVSSWQEYEYKEGLIHFVKATPYNADGSVRN